MPGLGLVGDETVRIEEPVPPAGRETVNGLRDKVSPVGETVGVRDRFPDSPLTLVRIMFELEEVPAGTDMKLGLADIMKPTTRTMTWTEWLREPIAPVTVTV